jgi:hypothetical protein
MYCSSDPNGKHHNPAAAPLTMTNVNAPNTFVICLLLACQRLNELHLETVCNKQAAVLLLLACHHANLIPG